MPRYEEFDESDTNGAQTFQIHLDEVQCDSPGSYRLKNMPGQINREQVIQRGNGLQLQCELLAVVHGTLHPEGPKAALLVLQFHFLGADGGTAGRRFREASIYLSFANGDEKVGGCNDPEVLAIAPQGTFTTGSQSVRAASCTSLGLGGVVSASMDSSSLSKVALGMRVEHIVQHPEKTAQQKTYGMKWIEGRNSGPQNAAKWIMKENTLSKAGISPTLKVAALVSPQTAGKFRATIAVDAKADFKYAIETKTARVCGKHAVDPVILNSSQDLISLEVAEVDKQNLAKCDLMRFSSLPESSRVV